MDLKFLDFEQPIAELEAKIDELRFVGDDSEVNINDEIGRLKAKSKSLTKTIFSDLSATINYGRFYPGNAYSDKDAKDFVMATIMFQF